MDKTVIDNLLVKGSDLGLKLLGALAIWIIGRWLISFTLNLIVARLAKKKVDHTLVGYARNTASVGLNIALVVVMLGVLGIETTSFAAFIAAAGIAIGAAWSGQLSNVAAGAFLVVLRPFKAGDYVAAASVHGTVVEVGLVVTTLVTPDNVRTYVGNSKVLGATLKNYNANTYRRIDLKGSVARAHDVDKTMAEVRERLSAIPNVLTDPAPEVRIQSFNEVHYDLAIRPYAHNDNYWQVYFDSVEALRDLLHSAGLHGGGITALEGEEAAEGEESEEGGEEEEAE